MQRGLKLSLCLFSLILLFNIVSAQEPPEQFHLKLLAVQENGKNLSGSDADLYLELKEGSGRVFLETFPLTKMDTQISTRFAKDIACNYFKLNCQKYDFIFTIKAKSNIIGGPSAGAAIAALTAVAVLNLNYNQEIAITGTINSGGLIGPVGGVKEKVEAASAIGLKTVLVAKGSGKQTIFEDNTSKLVLKTNLTRYAQENLSIEVEEVSDLGEVLFALTGQDLNQKEVIVVENKQYQEIMKGLQQMLCQRGNELEKEIQQKKINITLIAWEDLNRQKGLAENATLQKNYYSAASFCFGNNHHLKKELYLKEITTENDLQLSFITLTNKLTALEEEVNSEQIETIADLQTVMIVKERINDVKDQIKSFQEENLTLKENIKLLAYAEERYFSALSWKQFFAMDGKKFVLDAEALKNSCLRKISEGEERLQYASLFIGNIEEIKKKIDAAKKSLDLNEPTLCLIEAAQAKADADAILSSLGLEEEMLDSYLDSKNQAVERIISENSQEDIFPILGYSYYQYANSLRQQQKFTALVYFEYALELSELGIYFPVTEIKPEVKIEIDEKWFFLIAGVFLGLVMMYLFQKKSSLSS